MIKNLENAKWVSVRQLSELYPAFSESAIRWIIFNNQDNFESCLRRINRRVLISLSAFENWVESHSKKGKEHRVAKYVLLPGKFQGGKKK